MAEPITEPSGWYGKGEPKGACGRGEPKGREVEAAVCGMWDEEQRLVCEGFLRGARTVWADQWATCSHTLHCHLIPLLPVSSLQLTKTSQVCVGMKASYRSTPVSVL